MSRVIAFTGHRRLCDVESCYSDLCPDRVRLKRRLSEILIDSEPVRCISGMALGTDQAAAEVCVELNIPFTAAVPFTGQERLWPTESQAHYNWLLTRAAEVVVVSQLSDGPIPKLMQIRNEWMVDRCDVLVAVWNNSRGGTANCVRYARLMDTEIVQIKEW